MVQGYQRLGEIGNGDRHIGRSIQVPAKAVQQLQRFPKAPLCEIDPHHDRESIIQAAFPCPLWKDNARCPLGRDLELSLRQPALRLHRRQPTWVNPKALALHQLFHLVQRELGRRTISSGQFDLYQLGVSPRKQIELLPGGGVVNDHLQQITRLLQPVPLVPHLRQSNLNISFQQGKSLHLLDQVEGRLALLIGQTQLSGPHRRQREPLPDLDVGIAGGPPAHPLFDLQQPWQKLRALASDRIVDGEAARERDRLPDRLLVLVQRLLYHL